MKKRIINRKIEFVLVLLIPILIFMLSFLSAQAFEADTKVIGSSNTQYFQPNARGTGIIDPSSYWSDYGKEDCRDNRNSNHRCLP